VVRSALQDTAVDFKQFLGELKGGASGFAFTDGVSIRIRLALLAFSIRCQRSATCLAFGSARPTT
jgi:hypothetical protein